MKYNKLTIVEEYKTRTKQGRSQRRFKCSCDCGKYTDVEKAKVIGGITKSCGCIQKEMRKSLGDKQRLGLGESARNHVYSTYKKSAKQRDIEFNLSFDEFLNIIVKPCIYCGDFLSNKLSKPSMNGYFEYTGIDRYENSIGYTKDNSVPCCRVCNRVKTDMDIDTLFNHLIKMISNKSFWQRTS